MSFYQLIQGDCIDILPELETGSVDLVITSPPYWNLKDYGTSKYISYAHFLSYLKLRFIELFRVVRQEGKVCVNIGTIPTPTTLYGRLNVVFAAADAYQLLRDVGFDPFGVIYWHDYNFANQGGGRPIFGSYPYPSNLLVSVNIEPILIFRKWTKSGAGKHWSKEVKDKSKLTKTEWREWCQDYWKFPSLSSATMHPAAFPEELPKRLIKIYSFAGDMVLDPFMGSGTTMKVAQDLERNCIGIEINPEYCELIKKRCFGRTFLGREPPEYKFEVFE